MMIAPYALPCNRVARERGKVSLIFHPRLTVFQAGALESVSRKFTPVYAVPSSATPFCRSEKHHASVLELAYHSRSSCM